MILGQHINGSMRLMILATFAVALAIASFANSFAMMLGVVAVSFAGGFAVIMLTGAAVSVSRNRDDDDALPASIRLSNEDVG